MNIFLVSSQLGFCAIYFVFMGENLSEVCILEENYFTGIAVTTIGVLFSIRGASGPEDLDCHGDPARCLEH